MKTWKNTDKKGFWECFFHVQALYFKFSGELFSDPQNVDFVLFGVGEN